MVEKLDNLLFGLTWPGAPAVILLFMLLLALITLKTRSLTFGGALGAVVLGFCVTWTLRLEGLIVFLSFFILAQISGKLSGPAFQETSSHERRTIEQVFANGFMAALGGLFWYFTSSTLALVVFATSVAESFSDTLAGDIGKLSTHKPVSIINRLPVEKGQSGGITVLGVFAGFSGAAIIAVIWIFLFKMQASFYLAGLVCISGFTGCLADSFLGASVQAVYRDKYGKRTEKATDEEGNDNLLVRGIRVMDNNTVNFVSNVFAVMIAVSLYLIFE